MQQLTALSEAFLVTDQWRNPQRIFKNVADAQDFIKSSVVCWFVTLTPEAAKEAFGEDAGSVIAVLSTEPNKGKVAYIVTLTLEERFYYGADPARNA